jgi:2'-5' RNA ligase
MTSAGLLPPPRSGGPSRRAHALELVLDEQGELEVRRRWARLEEAGVASLARHSGVTHRPHVTLLSGPAPPREVLAAAGGSVVPQLPLTLDVAGLALLGPPGRATLVELVGVPPRLRRAREEVLGLWPGADGRPWVPHLTLARRLAPAAVAVALEALQERVDADGGAPPRRHVAGLRWWDPERGRVVPLGPEPGERGAGGEPADRSTGGEPGGQSASDQ